MILAGDAVKHLVRNIELVLDPSHHIADHHLRLDQEVIRPQLLGSLGIFRLRQGSQHNDVDITTLRTIAQDIQYVKAAQIRDHHVEQDQVRVILDSVTQGTLTIIAPPDIKPLQLQALTIDLRQCIIVFY